MKNIECLIFGSTGKLSRTIITSFLKNKFIVHGVSKKSRSKFQSLQYKHYLFNITNKLNKKIKKILLSKDLRFIIFCINKKEKNKNLEYDLSLLLKYHLFFPIRIAKFLKNKKNIKIILINSDSIFDNKVNFPYSASKLLSVYFIKYAQKLFPKLKFFSIILGKPNNQVLKKLGLLINNIIKNHSKYNSMNFLVEKKGLKFKI